MCRNSRLDRRPGEGHPSRGSCTRVRESKLLTHESFPQSGFLCACQSFAFRNPHLPAFVSRSPPDNSCMYPSWISRSLCSTGIVRCIKPLAQSRNETNSSWVNGADKSGFIFQICASGAAVQARFVCHNQADLLPGFLSGRLINSNEGTWVLFHHDSSAAPQTASPVCGTKNFSSVRLYSAPQLH